MSHRLDELAERIAALEAAIGSGGSPELDARLSAIETGLRRLSHGDEDLDEIEDVLRACGGLLERNVPDSDRVMVAWQGDPTMLALPSRHVVAFPRPVGAIGKRDLEDLAAIAHLEAQRAHDIRFLLIPETVRPWLERCREFEEHLSSRHRVVADEEGAGLLVDIGSRRADDRSAAGLGQVLDRILDGEPYAPVLDWTGFDLASRAGDRTIFAAPPDVDGELPYLDRTIDIVVLEDPEHLDEGRRVATSAVVLVRPDDAGGIAVAEVEELPGEPTVATEPIPLIIAGAEPGGPWVARVSEAVSEPPASPVIPAADAWDTESGPESDLMAIAEHGVLPLPGCIEAAAATVLRDERIGAVAVKLLDSDGILESAGTTVFADGSAEGIGGGSTDVSATWHEYVRPVCAASGLLVGRSSALYAVANGSGSALEISGRLRAAGHRIVYQPDACAVRALPGGRKDDATAAGEAWTEVLARRPERPHPLDDGAWHALLAHDDVEEAWQ